MTVGCGAWLSSWFRDTCFQVVFWIPILDGGVWGGLPPLNCRQGALAGVSGAAPPKPRMGCFGQWFWSIVLVHGFVGPCFSAHGLIIMTIASSLALLLLYWACKWLIKWVKTVLKPGFKTPRKSKKQAAIFTCWLAIFFQNIAIFSEKSPRNRPIFWRFFVRFFTRNIGLGLTSRFLAMLPRNRRCL